MTTAPPADPALTGARWRLPAFGLRISCAWELPGSMRHAGPETAADPATSVGLLSSEEMDAAWSPPARRIHEPPYPDGRRRFTVDRDDQAYRLWFQGFGRHLVTLDGRGAASERGPVSRDRRTRFLFAQVLPLAAVLHGYELLHASAVVGRAGVVAFAGPSGSGKTSIASRLVVGGAQLVTDDVLALRRDRDRLIVAPGPPFMAISGTDETLIAQAAGRLGATAGESDKLHLSPPAAGEAMPLRVLYHVEPGDRLAILDAGPGDAREALGGGFAPYVQTPDRLLRHLDVAALLNSTVTRFVLQKPRDADLDAVAAAVDAHHRRFGL